MADETHYVVCMPKAGAVLKTRDSVEGVCARCGATVFLARDGQAAVAAGWTPLCLNCGFDVAREKGMKCEGWANEKFPVYGRGEAIEVEEVNPPEKNPVDRPEPPG
jgi:hypothetical protein